VPEPESSATPSVEWPEAMALKVKPAEPEVDHWSVEDSFEDTVAASGPAHDESATPPAPLVSAATPVSIAPVAPEPTSGAAPEPTSGVAPEPTSGVAPEPTSGAAPEPAHAEPTSAEASEPAKPAGKGWSFASLFTRGQGAKTPPGTRPIESERGEGAPGPETGPAPEPLPVADDITVDPPRRKFRFVTDDPPALAPVSDEHSADASPPAPPSPEPFADLELVSPIPMRAETEPTDTHETPVPDLEAPAEDVKVKPASWEEAQEWGVEVPVFNSARLDASSMGSPELRAQLIQAFQTQIMPKLEQLDQAIKVGDAAAAERVAHSLKGMCATVGAMRCAQAFDHMERMGREKRIDALRYRFERALPEVARADEALGQPPARAA